MSNFKTTTTRVVTLASLVTILSGFSMCTKTPDNEAESLKRAQTACIQMLKGFFPEKVKILGQTDAGIVAIAMLDKYKDLPSEWDKVKALPFIESGVDSKIEAIVGNTSLSSDESNAQLVSAVQNTEFWNQTCGVRFKNELKRCADKFPFDSADWSNCLKASPMASNDFVGEWSPFYREYQKKIRPRLREAASAGGQVNF